MSVKASISLTEPQDTFARALVADGRYPSLSAVLQRGLDLLRVETEARAAETEALRMLLRERQAGAFVNAETSRVRIRDLLSAKKTAHGL